MGIGGRLPDLQLLVLLVSGVSVLKGQEEVHIHAPMVISNAGLYNTYEKLLPKELQAMPGRSETLQTVPLWFELTPQLPVCLCSDPEAAQYGEPRRQRAEHLLGSERNQGGAGPEGRQLLDFFGKQFQ